MFTSTAHVKNVLWLKNLKGKSVFPCSQISADRYSLGLNNNQLCLRRPWWHINGGGGGGHPEITHLGAISCVPVMCCTDETGHSSHGTEEAEGFYLRCIHILCNPRLFTHARITLNPHCPTFPSPLGAHPWSSRGFQPTRRSSTTRSPMAFGQALLSGSEDRLNSGRTRQSIWDEWKL